jgi:hypothetical protein
VAKAIAQEAQGAGFAGIVIMGLRFETAVGEAYDVWHDDKVAALEPVEAHGKASVEVQ